MAAHARSLRADLTQAGTATEVELLSTHADACLDIEADWQSLFFAAQGAPLGAALNFALSPTEAERGLRGASVICSCLLGQAPAATLHSALVQAVLQRHLAENAFGTGSDAVAWRGETGHGLLPLLSAWRAVAASRGVAVPQDRTGLTAALQPMTGLEPDATASAPPVVVQLWGQRADARDAAQLLAAPGRPALPLWQGPGDASDAV
jgi:hypothetical protein